jgi:hypothetical protein
MPNSSVVSLKAQCNGQVLQGILVMAKILSNEKRHQGHPKVVVDISGSRAAIEASAQLKARRVIGLHVSGAFFDCRGLALRDNSSPVVFQGPKMQRINSSIYPRPV